MKNAGSAMKQIHGNLTIDKVDATMDELREQHALGEEIATAITNAPIGDPIDEADLEEELEGLEQEAMDERMLKTGPTPVTGEINRLPAVATGPGKSRLGESFAGIYSNHLISQEQYGRRRRGRGTSKAASRDGSIRFGLMIHHHGSILWPSIRTDMVCHGLV